MKSIISFVCVFVISFFINISDCQADEIDSDLNNNLSKDSTSNDVKTNINNKDDIPKSSNEDIFGDEQTFPFVAGLGKNAAH